INGEAASGSGQSLTADAGTVAEGLVVRILADAAGVAARSGDFGTVTTTDGIKKTLVDRLKLLSDPFDGTIHSVSEGVDQTITSLQDREASLQAHLDDRRAFLTVRFQRAEQALNALQSTQISSLLGNVRF
ncbi:MAG: hypothetical protein ACE5ID_11270, partial [Acidobacteriota bacterium]